MTQRQNSNARGDEDEIEVARLKCPQYFGEVDITIITYIIIVKLRQGSGKDWQGMAVKAKGLKA